MMNPSSSESAGHLHSKWQTLILKHLLPNPEELLRAGSVLAIAAIFAATLFSAIPLQSQVEGTGTIQGVVSDSSGAVIKGATVTATNAATGLKFSQKTSDGGTYAIAGLPAGEYTVDIQAAGFGPVRQQHLIVNAVTQVGLNITLQVGSIAQEVVVSAAPPDLQTENGTVETTIPHSTYNALPIAMNGGPKSPIGFLYLVPGVTSGRFDFIANGGMAESSAIYVNGLPLASSELQGGGENLNLTSTEDIEQFQVLTSGIPANYDGQGVANLVFKSGTNHIHGSVYENIRNTAFDAKGFFTSGPTPVEHQNEYGGTIGGPALHNRLFYFGNYDGFKITQGSTPLLVTIPTAAERSGDFSALPVPIYDPATTTCSGGICTRTAFPGNKIPASRISSVAGNLQSYLPAAQNSNLENNFSNTFTNGLKQHMYLARADATITSNNHATFLFQKGVKSFNYGAALPLPYASTRSSAETYYAAQVSDTQIITPNLLNVFGAQYMRTAVISTDLTVNGNYPSKAGLTGLPAGQPSTAFPTIQFSGPIAPYPWAQNTTGFGEVPESFTYQDNVHWTHGTHSMTFGGQVIFEQEALNIPSQLQGINFSNTETATFNSDGSINANTGNAYASYLLGLVDNANAQDTSIQETGGRWRNYALYAQDDWKATPKLTINFGLRYTIPKPFVEVQNRTSWLNPTLPNPLADGALGLAEAAGNGPGSCHCRTNVKTHYLTFGPRFGFAYAVNSRTVVRSSFAMVHFNGAALGGNGEQQGSGTLGYGTASPSFQSPDGGISPAFLLNNGFPPYTRPTLAFQPTVSTGFTTTIPQGGGITYNRPNTAARSPYTEEWNLNFERELPASMVMSLGYNGTSTHFTGVQGGVGIYSNQVDPKYLVLGNLLNQPESPATLAQVQAQFPGVKLPYANFAGSIGQMLRPFPQYGQTGGTFQGPDQWAALGTNSYNGFQASLTRRMTNGLYLLAAYTWSKSFDEGGEGVQFFGQAPRTAYNLGAERAVSTQDMPHVLSFSEVYALPFGKGHWLGGDNSVVNAVLGGWQISGIEQYNAGTPIGTIFGNCNDPYMGGIPLISASAPCYANYNPAFAGNLVINGGIGHGQIRGQAPQAISYFNVNAFQNAAPFTFGNTPRELAFSSMRNQWGKNENVAISKTFKITENVDFEFKADAFNVFNRTQFGGINTNINSTTFGQISGQANAPRELQFEGYIRF